MQADKNHHRPEREAPLVAFALVTTYHIVILKPIRVCIIVGCAIYEEHRVHVNPGIPPATCETLIHR